MFRGTHHGPFGFISIGKGTELVECVYLYKSLLFIILQ